MTIEDSSLMSLLKEARELSWQRFGKRITFYVPGMFVCHGVRGKYPAISLTGSECALQCDHCRGKLLEPMIHAVTPADLLETCLRLDERGAIGCLISGGSSVDGRLPWDEFVPVIYEIKEKTRLNVSVHTGFVSLEMAEALKKAGVDQALIDVIGSEETLGEVFHLDFGLARVEETLAALFGVGLEVIPHIVIGAHGGEIRGEMRALEMLKKYIPSILVFVVMMPLKGTPMYQQDKPSPAEVAEIIARSRLALPGTEISLGCARPRDKRGELIELYALEAGVNRMALYSDEVIQRAKNYNLEITYQKTCCSFN